MDQMVSRLTGLNSDLVVDILGRLDGSTVASFSCTCSDLRDAARDRELWRRACHSLWPSTSIHGIDSSLIPDFKRFYADSFPLVYYGPNRDGSPLTAQGNAIPEVGACGFQDFTSLVDVYYKGKCLLSRAMSHEHTNRKTRDSWFMNSPFQWDILEFHQSDSTIDSYANSDAEQVQCSKDQRTELEEYLRLSWVLLDKKMGRSVNLSNWVPIISKKSWACNGGTYTVHFGSIVPAQKSSVPCGAVKCTIAVSCRFIDGDVALEIDEIGLHIEDWTGKHLNGKESLVVLKQALLCPRSTNKMKVKEGFHHYEMKKKELTRNKEVKERLAIGLYAFIQISVFVGLYCLFTSRFT